MRFLIPFGLSFLPLICSEPEGAGVIGLGKNLQTQVDYQAPSQANVWELTDPSLALRITPPLFKEREAKEKSFLVLK